MEVRRQRVGEAAPLQGLRESYKFSTVVRGLSFGHGQVS